MGTGREVFTLKAQGQLAKPVLLLPPVFSRDGTRLAARGKDGPVRVYDAHTGQEAYTLGTPVPFNFEWSDPVFSPDGTRIAARGGDSIVRVYDAGTGREVLSLKASGGAFAPAFNPSGARIAAAAGNVVRLYDAQTGQEAGAPIPVSGPPVFSPDGSRLAIHDRGELRMYNARTGQEGFTRQGLVGLFATGTRFSPDGTRIAALGREGDWRAFDAQTGQEVLIIRGRPRSVPGRSARRRACRGWWHRRRGPRVRRADWSGGLPSQRAGPSPAPVFSPDGTLLAIGNASRFDGRNPGGEVVRLYDARMGQEALALRRPSGTEPTIATRPVFSPDGLRLAVPAAPAPFGGDGVLRVYDLRTGQEALALHEPTPVFPVFSPDGSRLTLACEDGVLRLFDARTGLPGLTVKGTAKLTFAVFSPDGTRLAAVDENGAVQVYDAGTGRLALRLEAPSGSGCRSSARTAHASPSARPFRSARALAARTTDPTMRLRVYDAQTGKEVFPALPVGLTAVTLQVFSPDGKHLAAVGRDGLLRVYDVQTGQQVQALAVSPANPLLLFSPDGTRLAALGADTLPRLYDWRTGREAFPPIKGPGMLVITAFSPDGTRLATLCDGDGALRLYDAQTGQEAMTFKAPVKLSSAAFSPDGTRLVAAGADGVVRVWTAPDDLAAHQKQRWQGLWDGSAGWHGSQAEECLHQHQWFAAAFHIEAASWPPDGPLAGHTSSAGKSSLPRVRWK